MTYYRRKFSLSFPGSLIILLTLTNTAQSNDAVSTTGAQTLRRLISARPLGLGETYAGMSGDISSMLINPAGLAKLEHPEISTTYQRTFAEQNFGSIEAALPLRFGSLFIGGGYFDAGTIELNQSDGTTGKRRTQQDMVGMTGLALGKGWPVSLGLTGKFFRSELAEAASASVFGFDAGVHWKTSVPGLGFGAAVQNLGSDIKYENEGDPLPTTYRAGAAFDIDLVELGASKAFPYQFLILADGVKVKNEKTGIHTGLEIRRNMDIGDAEGSAALRGGYRSESHAFDVGIGFLIANVSIDYSLGIVQDLDVTHRFTLGYKFIPAKKHKL